MKKSIIILIVIVLVVALGINGKNLLKNRQDTITNQPKPKSPDITVPVVKVKQGELRVEKPFIASVISHRSIKLSSKLAGYIESIHVKEAQVVKRGELLIDIDSVELKSSIKSLEQTYKLQIATMKVQQSVYDRAIKLFEVGGLSKEKLELSKLALDSKQTSLDITMEKIKQIKHQLSYLHIEAPFDGQIDTIILHEGDLAATGKPILAMSSMERRLRFTFVSGVKIGQKVYRKQKYLGRVTTIMPSAQNSLSVAEVILDTKIDRPIGASVEISVLTDTQQGCMLPNDTILHQKNSNSVMLYKDKKFVSMDVVIKSASEYMSIVEPCPSGFVAKAGEPKLLQLPAFDNVGIVEVGHE